MKKDVFILTLSDLRYDARVRRQVQALKSDYKITLSGFSSEPSEEYEVVPIEPTRLTFWRKLLTSVFLILRMFAVAHRILHAYLPVLQGKLRGKNFDLIIANDVETLPLAFSLPGKHRVIFDAHEYAPRHFEDKRMWRFFFQPFNTWLCRRYLPKVDAMMTVGSGLAREYKKNFAVDPVVIPNANTYFDLEPSPMIPDRIRLVHVGIANPSRKLELMLDLLRYTDSRFTLDLYLLIPGFASAKTRSYIDTLKAMIHDHDKVKIHPPIPSIELVKTINSFDMGVFLLPPINFNYENTLPNKLFDFIQARLAVAIGPTPEMAAIVQAYNIGVVANDFDPATLATELNRLSHDDIKRFKTNSSLAARDFNAEKNAVVMKEMVASVLAKT